jgi:hypothetical protein
MQGADLFEKQAKPDFSKSYWRLLRLRRTNSLSAESKFAAGVRPRGHRGNFSLKLP